MALRAGYYGIKSGIKAKLAEIVGTWDQVKNEVDKVLPDGIIANTDLLKDTVGWSGKNHFDNTQPVMDRTSTTNRTITNTGVRVTNTEATAYGYVRFDLRLSANTDYTISSKITRNGGVCHILIRGSADDTTYTTLIDKTYNTGDIEDTFNTGNNTYIRLYLYCSLAESVVGDITYDELMICDANILDDTYEPYFGSTVETILLDHKTTINAIITAATGAADFAAFKTAMGAITPVTRSLSLTKEDITEEVKEDVEPEKTVTKKRTTKKTEEV